MLSILNSLSHSVEIKLILNIIFVLIYVSNSCYNYSKCSAEIIVMLSVLTHLSLKQWTSWLVFIFNVDRCMTSLQFARVCGFGFTLINFYYYGRISCSSHIIEVWWICQAGLCWLRLEFSGPKAPRFICTHTVPYIYAACSCTTPRCLQINLP